MANPALNMDHPSWMVKSDPHGMVTKCIERHLGFNIAQITGYHDICDFVYHVNEFE